MEENIEGGWLKQIYFAMAKSQKFLSHFLILFIRLYWGGLLITTGIGKLMNIHGVADFFTLLNIPAPLLMAYSVGIIETTGGISLFMGLFSRIFSTLLVLLFFAAYLTAHQEALVSFFTNPALFIIQEPFLYLYASLLVMCFGPGFISIDYWKEKRAYGKAL